MEGFLFVYLPAILFVLGCVFLTTGFYKQRKGSPYKINLVLGFLFLIIPVIKFFLLLFAFPLGGPIPT